MAVGAGDEGFKGGELRGDGAAGVGGVKGLREADGVGGFGGGERVGFRDGGAVFGGDPQGEESAEEASSPGPGEIEVVGGVGGEEVDADFAAELMDFMDGVVVAVEDGDQVMRTFLCRRQITSQ